MQGTRHALRILYLLPFLLSALAVSSLAVAADTRLIPIDTGQTFTYTAKDSAPSPNTWTEKMTISGLLVIPPTKIYYAVDNSGGGSVKTVAMRSTSNAFYRYKGLGAEYIEWMSGSVGTKWTYTDGDGHAIEREILAIEDVTVPAGTYTGCLKIQGKCTNCGVGNFTWIEWVKPGFTMVKWVDYWTDNPPVTHRLVSWTP